MPRPTPRPPTEPEIEVQMEIEADLPPPGAPSAFAEDDEGPTHVIEPVIDPHSGPSRTGPASD